MTGGAAVEAAIASAHRREWARVLAATARVARDLDLAEECVQEAYAAAMQTWVSDGIPDNPATALAEVEKLERDGRLTGYHYLPAVKADLLSRIGRTGEAADSYRQAFDLAANEAERAFLAGQIADHT